MCSKWLNGATGKRRQTCALEQTRSNDQRVSSVEREDRTCTRALAYDCQIALSLSFTQHLFRGLPSRLFSHETPHLPRPDAFLGCRASRRSAERNRVR